MVPPEPIDPFEFGPYPVGGDFEPAPERPRLGEVYSLKEALEDPEVQVELDEEYWISDGTLQKISRQLSGDAFRPLLNAAGYEVMDGLLLAAHSFEQDGVPVALVHNSSLHSIIDGPVDFSYRAKLTLLDREDAREILENYIQKHFQPDKIFYHTWEEVYERVCDLIDLSDEEVGIWIIEHPVGDTFESFPIEGQLISQERELLLGRGKVPLGIEVTVVNGNVHKNRRDRTVALTNFFSEDEQELIMAALDRESDGQRGELSLALESVFKARASRLGGEGYAFQAEREFG